MNKLSVMYRNDWIKKYRYELLLCSFLIVAPFFIYFHLLFDDESTTLSLFGFEFDHGHSSTQYFVWLTISEINSIIFLTIMFFNLGYKWKYILFVPLSMFVIDFIDIFSSVMDTYFMSLIYKFVVVILFLAGIIKLDKEYFSQKRIDSLSLKLSRLKRIGHLSTANTQQSYLKHYSKGDSYLSLGELYKLYSKKIFLKKIVERFTVQDIITPLGSFWTDILWISLILGSISIRFIPDFIPQGLSTLHAGPFTIKAYGFLDISIFIWYLSQKVIILVPLIICYLNIRSWWRYAILSPIILYLYQFWESFQDLGSVDAHTNVKIFPIVFLSVLVVIALSRLVKQQYQTLDTYDELSEKIDDLIQKLSEERTGLSEYKKRYAQILDKLLKRNSSDLDLKELEQLQEELRAKMA